MFLEMRCQIHSELALIEEEDGSLVASLTHLQKALQLDNGSLRERLSAALSLVQLKQNLNWTLTRAEDKAAILLLQVYSTQPHARARVHTHMHINTHTQKIYAYVDGPEKKREAVMCVCMFFFFSTKHTL